MGSVSQSVALPSLLAAPTLATNCVLSWTTTAVVRATTATGGVEAKFLEAVAQCCLVQLFVYSNTHT